MANPANSQLRYGFEQTAGHGNPAAWQDFRFRSETLGGEIPTIEDDSIRAGGEQEQGLPTKIIPDGQIAVNWHPEDHLKAIAGFFGKGATPVQSPTGVYTHKFSALETALTFGTMAIEAHRDVGRIAGEQRPTLYTSCKPRQLTFNAGPRSLLNGVIEWAVARFHFWTDMATVTGTGLPTDVKLRGYPTYDILRLADGDLYGKVTTAPAAGVVGMKFKIGAGTTYDGDEILIDEGAWNVIDKSTNATANEDPGSPDLPLEIYPGASVAAFELNDEFRFDLGRPVWSQSLPTANPLNEIAIIVLVDGVAFRTRDVGLTIARPVEPDEVIGGRFVDEVVEFGQRTAAWTLNRRALDMSFADRLLRAESVQIRLDAYGTFIGATGVRRKLSLVSLNCVPAGRTPSVGGAASFDEPITLTAHPSADVNYPAAITAEVVVSQAAA